MIPDLGPHAAFIWTSYAIEALVLAGLIAWLIIDGRSQTAKLAELEQRRASPKPAKI